MKKAVGYIRVSTEEQRQSGLSIELQEKKIRQYAELEELELVEIINDAGKSAKNMNREGLQEIIRRVKAREIEAVVIYKLDRLTRNLRDLNSLVELMNKHDVALASVSDHLDTHSAAGRMVIYILGTMAQWERETIGERTKDALAVLKDNGKRYTNIIPYGKMLEGDGLVEDPAERDVIRKIRTLRAEGVGMPDIAALLTAQGITARNGKPFTKQWIFKILKTTK